MKIDHITKSEDKCPNCGKNFEMYWKDKYETNGIREMAFGFDEVCVDCKEEETGRKVKTLQDLNNERRMANG